MDGGRCRGHRTIFNRAKTLRRRSSWRTKRGLTLAVLSGWEVHNTFAKLQKHRHAFPQHAPVGCRFSIPNDVGDVDQGVDAARVLVGLKGNLELGRLSVLDSCRCHEVSPCLLDRKPPCRLVGPRKTVRVGNVAITSDDDDNPVIAGNVVYGDEFVVYTC